MNSYECSDGTRLKQSVIERLITKAKAQKVRRFLDDNGYVFCENCKVSNSFKFDLSHRVSIKDAKESGRTELCFDVENLDFLCRECHKKRDGLN